ncbi:MULTISPECIES: DeoR/GlpR family DNA-binding transcription regulator [Eubacteriales]|uniref:HTH deoR-type domain-containing protein n=1 Tax=Clostridium isatidis TaxID=182773 RepID=A0A343JCK3_9CLOT|nr:MULTISPECIES: DeoR/GlpR family DNA-binding transcription regulator [Eubacteriales]ASW43261.1 hypothetical protein BEN51_07125 [Clostridium isatidis]MBU5453823.1 DeoR/GlpR family DNA-binding transcription regulator [Caproiciproducens sp. MSJ-32]
MIASERKIFIINELNKKGVVNLKEIAAQLNISEATVRRDFEKLEKEGKLKRVLGGATITDENYPLLDNAELTMNEKISLNYEEKNKISIYASQFVKDGDCVFIDGGTTLVPLIRYLSEKRIKIVTHSNLAMSKIINNVNAEIFLIGGLYLPYYGMSVGPIAQNMLKNFHFDHAFIGCSGVDLEAGISYTTEVESPIMKTIAMENSKHSYLLIDSSKLDKRGFFKFKSLDEFDKIICNSSSTELEIPENFIFI